MGILDSLKKIFGGKKEDAAPEAGVVPPTEVPATPTDEVPAADIGAPGVSAAPEATKEPVA